MDDKQMLVTDQPEEAVFLWFEDNINQFNMHVTGYHDYRPLAIVLHDHKGAIIAGLTAFTWGGTLRILVLWIDEAWRRHSFGSHLLAAAEQEALARGCKQSVVDTHSFQAPEFYPKHGYTVCGVIDDYPIGYQQIIFQKRLI
jgi:GNAT superfamily N-acetyltransferase